MFPRPESRFRDVFRRSVDAAIDFATLGEYGLASAWEDPADPGPGTDPRSGQALGLGSLIGTPGTGAGPAVARPPIATSLRPASAAGRARADGERRSAPLCAGQHLRSRVMDPLPRTSRSRDGMAPREPRCLFDPGG